MNQETIHSLGQQADWYADNQTGGPHDWKTIRDEHFAQLVAKAERKRCCSIIFGMCSSDNTAQRTVDAIWKGHK